MNTPVDLVQFTTADGFALPGLLFVPKRKTKRAAIFLHGNGSSSVFYSQEKLTALAQALDNKEVALLAFNNRGAQWMHRLYKNRKQKVNQGTAYEVIKDCVKDIDAAVNFLRQNGFRELYLIGMSTGANKICVHNFLKRRNAIKKYILLSGGDDTGLYWQRLGAVKIKKWLTIARQKIKRGKGTELMPLNVLGVPYSYQAFYDIANPNGLYNCFPFREIFTKHKASAKPWFREYKTITKRTLVIYGELDEYCYGRTGECMKVLRDNCPRPELFKFELIKNADHGFTGKDKLLAKLIADWI